MPHRLAWIALSLFYLFLRFQNTPGVLTDHGVVFPDTDPYYRLQRIESMVRADLRYPLHDPKLNYPDGFDVPWPAGLDLTLALPLKLFRVRSEAAMEAFCAVAIPLLSLPTLWAAGYVATQMGGPAVGLAAGLLLSVLRGHIDASDIGSVDHHFLEALITILALALLIRVRERKRRFSYAALGVLLGLAPSFWPQGWVIGIFLALSFAMDRDRKEFLPVTKLFLASGILSLAPLSLSARFGSGYVSLFGFSWWTPLLYSLLAIFFAGIAFLRRESRATTLWVALFPVAVGAFLLIRNGLGGAAASLTGGYGAMDAAKGTMAITSEAISPGRVGLLRWFRMGYHAIVLGWLWFATMSFRRERWWLVGYALGPLALTMIQIRFFPLAAPVLAVSIALLIGSAIPMRISQVPVRLFLVFLFAAIVALPTLAGLSLTHQENIHPFFVPVRGASRFIAREKERLSIPANEGAVASQWDFGHWILHDTDSPVVANPFQPASSAETADMFTSRGMESLEAFVQRHPIRYLIVEATTGRMLRWFKMLGKDPTPYFKPVSNPSGGRPYVDVLPPFYDLLIARLFFAQGENADGEHPRNWRLAYVSPFASPDNSGMPALKVYERVKGARLVLRHQDRELLLSAKIKFRSGEFLFRQTGKPNRFGRIEWIVPYARTENGGVLFPGRYTIEGAKQVKILVTPEISEEAVLQGETIDLQKMRFKAVGDLWYLDAPHDKPKTD